MSTAQRLPELENLAEQIGEFIHYWGFKRVHGRIWTHLFLASAPLDAAELVRRMQISKALISISLRELLEYDVILSAGRSARGTQLYRTNPDILSVILNVLRQREKRLLSQVASSQTSLQSVDSAERGRFGLSADRLEALGALIGRGSDGLEALISLRSVDFGEWRDAFMTSQEDPEQTNLAQAEAYAVAEPKRATVTGPGSIARSEAALGPQDTDQRSDFRGPGASPAIGIDAYRTPSEEAELFLPRGCAAAAFAAPAQRDA